MARELEPYQNIERSIIKKFRKEIWRPFIEAVQRYELVNEGDKIAVCISGGKDSMLMAKLMQELQRHSKVKFELVTTRSTDRKSRATQSFYTSQSRFLRRMSLRLPIRAKKIRAIYVHACVGAIYTARHRSLAATKLPWDIISVTSSRRP